MVSNSMGDAHPHAVEQHDVAEPSEADGAGTAVTTRPGLELPAAGVQVGDTVEFEKRLSDEDVREFAAISGDRNPLHLDEEFAAQTVFSERIVHGMLASSLISAALARLPGTTVYLSQDLEFHRPVHLDDHVTAECEIVEDLGGDTYRLTTRVVDDDREVLIDGEAVVLVDDHPAE